jgi:serine/threonine protein kinase
VDPPPPPPRHWAPPPRRDGNHAQFVDSFETSTEVQLVLELLSGGTLLGLLERQGKLPEAHARKVVCEIASGLAALHLIGVVHRDLKPENVLFDGAGRAKLTDFGLSKAKLASPARSRVAYSPCGTPGFAAPEVLLRSGHNSEAHRPNVEPSPDSPAAFRRRGDRSRDVH